MGLRRPLILALLLAGPLMPGGWGARASEAGVDWQAAGWHGDLAEARRRARRTQRPLFLYFDAPWCSWCQRYERETLGRERVQRVLRRETVPVRLDWDRRADLVSRYGGRGLPFQVLLGPDGAVLHTFTGILAPADLIALLRRPPDAEPAPSQAGSSLRSSLDREAYRAFREAFLDRLERLYAPDWGTLAGRHPTGRGLKRAQPRTWLWLRDHGLWPKRTARAARVERQRLHDPVDGGFFYYVDPHRDTGHRETAKLAGHTAWMSAWQAQSPGTPARHAALAGWFYLQEVLWDDARGGFRQAQLADAAYYAREPAERLVREAPAVDGIKRADTNAEVARALLAVAAHLQRPAAAHRAAAAVDFVLGDLLRDGQLHHSRRGPRLGPVNRPEDLLRVLIAGDAVQRRGRDARRGRRLAVVAERAGEWLRGARAAGERPGPELTALAARACGLRERFPALPEGCQGWALRRLRLGPQTRPDWLIPGLRAWEARLTGG